MLDNNQVHESTNDFLKTWSDVIPAGTDENGNASPAAPVAPVIETPVVNDTADDFDEVPEVKAAPKQKESLSDGLAAELIIGSIDATQTFALGAAITRRLKRRLGEQYDEAMALMESIESGAEQAANLQGEKMLLYVRAKDLWHEREELCFSDDERDKLQEPLSKILKESGYEMPPSFGFMLAISEVMAPRLAGAFM